MMMHLLIEALLLAFAGAQGINETTVFAFYDLATQSNPVSFDDELYSVCRSGCDMPCDGDQVDCSMLAAQWCAEQVVISGNASKCALVRFDDDLGRAVALGARAPASKLRSF